MARLGMSPADLDPLEAASAPLMPDPMAGGGRVGRHVRATVAASNNRDEAHRVLAMQLMEEGYSASEAARIAARDLAVDAFDSNRSTPAAPAAQVAAPPALDPDMEPLTADELRDRKQNPYSEPGVRMPDGTAVRPPAQFRNERSARAYNTRTPVTDQTRDQVLPDAAYHPSMRDEAMAARGFFPVYAPDGSVSYSVGTGSEALYEQDLDRRGIPGSPGRLGPRRDLQETDPSRPGFTLEPVRGPTGTNYIYKQNEAAQKQQAGYMQEQQIARFADASGLTEAELTAMTPEQRRSAVRGAKRSDAAGREEAWRAQMMLGGGRPTGGVGGSKAVVNALESLPDDQRNSSLRYMLPGGQLAAAVDGRTNEQLAELGLRVATGRGFQQPDQRLVDAQLAELEQKRRAGDPVAAGRAAASAGDTTDPFAQKEFDRLAAQFDSGTGDNGGDSGFFGAGDMSDRDEKALAIALTQPPYSLDATLARQEARAAADRRRFFYNKRGTLPAAPAAATPPAAPTGPAGATPAPRGGI